MTKAGTVAGSSGPRPQEGCHPGPAHRAAWPRGGRCRCGLPPWLAGKAPSQNSGVMRTVAPGHHVGNEDTGHHQAVTNHSGSV